MFTIATKSLSKTLVFFQVIVLLLVLSTQSCVFWGNKCENEDELMADSIRRADSLARIDSIRADYDMHHKMLPDTMFQSAQDVYYAIRVLDTIHDSLLSDLVDPYLLDSNVLTFRGNSFRNADFGGYVQGRPTDLQVEWEFTTDVDMRETNKGSWGGGTGWTGQPLLCDSMVVVSSLASRVYFLDWETGHPLQPSIYVTNPIKGTAMIDPQDMTKLYVGQGVAAERPWGSMIIDMPMSKIIHFYAEDPQAWRGWGAYDSSPIRVGQFIFRPSENGTIYKWFVSKDTICLHSTLRYRVGGSAPGMESSMAIYKNYGYIADNHGNIICVNLNTLRPIWHYDNHDDTDASLVIELENDTPFVYTGCEVDHQGQHGFCYLTKLNGLNGECVWQQPIECKKVSWNETKDNEGGLFATPLLGRANCKDLLFVPCITNMPALRGDLLAVEKSTGSIRYRLPLDWYPWMSPVGFVNEDGEEYIVAGDTQGKLYLIDGLSGEVICKKQIGSNFESSPAVRGNHFVVGSRGCKIYKICVL